MDLLNILNDAVGKGASDIFILAGLPLSFKINGQIIRSNEEKLIPQQTKKLIDDIYNLANDRSFDHAQEGDDDFSFSIAGVSRFRANVYKQRGSYAAVIRVVCFSLPDPKELKIPQSVLELGDRPKGLVLITGPAGSGKSTTLACIIDRINHTRNAHIITLEDPIEFLHRHDKSIISQREISLDTDSYVTALRASLRQSPNVILLGEMRDWQTMSIAMTAAETGHLVLSTLHTVGAANTIDRIVDAFPPNQQHQIRVQLSMVLLAVVSQQLVTAKDGSLVPAFEIMFCNPAVRNMIRESKTHQLDSLIFSSAEQGMITIDSSLLELYKAGTISKQEALSCAASPETLLKRMEQ